MMMIGTQLRWASCWGRHGFSLIELVIVIVIMGTVAVIAVPRMSQAAASAQQSTLQANIRQLNASAEQYATEHEGLTAAQRADGAVDLVPKNLVLRLTSSTTIAGSLLGTRKPFGPYLRAIPVNPMNGLDSIRIDGNVGFSGGHGWRFDSATNTFSTDHVAGVRPAVVGGGADVGAGPVDVDVKGGEAKVETSSEALKN